MIHAMRRACVVVILRNQEEAILAWATRHKIMLNFFDKETMRILPKKLFQMSKLMEKRWRHTYIIHVGREIFFFVFDS
jgi:hypothetical protein